MQPSTVYLISPVFHPSVGICYSLSVYTAGLYLLLWHIIGDPPYSLGGGSCPFDFSIFFLYTDDSIDIRG